MEVPYYKWQSFLERGESVPYEMGEEMFCTIIALENQISHLYDHIATLVNLCELHEKWGDVLMQDISTLEMQNKELVSTSATLYDELHSLKERLEPPDF